MDNIRTIWNYILTCKLRPNTEIGFLLEMGWVIISISNKIPISVYIWFHICEKGPNRLGNIWEIGEVVFTARESIDSIVSCLSISNKFKQNLMQNVDSAHFQQNPNISVSKWNMVLVCTGWAKFYDINFNRWEDINLKKVIATNHFFTLIDKWTCFWSIFRPLLLHNHYNWKLQDHNKLKHFSLVLIRNWFHASRGENQIFRAEWFSVWCLFH